MPLSSNGTKATLSSSQREQKKLWESLKNGSYPVWMLTFPRRETNSEVVVWLIGELDIEIEGKRVVRDGYEIASYF